MSDAPQSLITLLTIGALTIVPFIFMTTTSFVKISVVFTILRNALGTSEVPSSAVITALAAILSLYVMAPVGGQIVDAAGPSVEQLDPSNPLADLDALSEVIDRGVGPVRAFLERNAGERERALFVDLARQARADSDSEEEVAEDDLLVLLPSFLITELGEAFQIGFLVFLPFLVVDLVVANVLMSLGMHMLNPTQVSMPFKLLLFVLVDGWYLLSRALILGYASG